MTMAKTPDKTKSQKDPAKPTRSKAHRPDVQPIGPALAELLNPALNSGDAGIGSGTGLKPPPDNSKDRRSGGEAAAHRARASTQANDTLPREPSVDRNMTRNTIVRRDSPDARPSPRAAASAPIRAPASTRRRTASRPTTAPPPRCRRSIPNSQNSSASTSRTTTPSPAPRATRWRRSASRPPPMRWRA